MKNTLITLTVLFNLNITLSLVAQSNQYLLVTVENSFSLQDLKRNNDFNSLKTQFNILSMEHVFSNSKKENLRQVFALTCDCSYTELSEAINNNYPSIIQPEIVEETELLVDIPNDYSLVFSHDYSLELIQAKEAWEITTGNPEVIIGISDSNYDLSHQEFSQKIAYLQPYLNNSNITHGTAVAISAAGATNNGVGKSAIGYNSKLSLHDMSFNGVLNARNQGARVVNLSWASSCMYITYHQNIINELFEDGVIVVAAAGNGETCGGPDNLVYPAAYDNVIAVTSVGPTFKHEQIEGNTNSTHQHNASVDIAAPGYSVPLAFPNNTYGTGTGTSFAAPLVSGTVGLMLSVNEKLNPCEVEIILKNTALNIDSLNEPYEGKLGAGALNAFQAVKLSQDFINTSVFGEIFPGLNSENGNLNIVVNSQAPIESYYADLISTDTNSTGDVVSTYEVFVTYETGCTFKTIFKSNDAEYYNDSLVVLPVEDLTIKANQEGQSARISWTTESEVNNSHFELYKSVDGFNWEMINSQSGVGYSTSTSEYSYLDNRLVGSIQYYRIHQFDFNGSESTSDIVSLSVEQLNQINLFPNPCVSQSNLTSDSIINTVHISNQTGKIVEVLYPNAKEVSILTDNFTKGIFYLSIQLENGDLETKKLIIN